MSIANEITNYANGLSDAYDAVNDMQGIIPTDKNMNNLDTAIRTIPQSQGSTYTAGNGINIDANNEISIDTSVVAEISDLPTNFTGATSSVAGTNGLVPAPSAGDEDKVLKGDGTWATVSSGSSITDYFISSALDTITLRTNFSIYTDSAMTTVVSRTDFYNSVMDGIVRLNYDSGGSDNIVYYVELSFDNAGGYGTNQEPYYVAREGFPESANYIIDWASIFQLPLIEAVITYQRALTAGSNITISNNTISATDTTYSAGTGISIDANNVISATGGGGSVITFFYADPTQTGATRSLYKDDTLTTAATMQDILDASEDGVVIMRTDSSDQYGQAYIDASLQNVYFLESEDYTVMFLGEGKAYHFNSSYPAATTFSYWETEYQQKLTAGTNVTITGNTISATDTTYSNFTGATSSVAGANGLVPAPAAGDQGKALLGDGTWGDPTAKLVEMSYGESSAWAKFIAAYNAGSIVYCRASSNANPGTGSQTRKAFMAYVNNATSPTSVEFQYVRSVSSKSASQPVDQVFVYTLTNSNGGTWSVATRDMAPKLAAGTNTSVSYASGTYTISATAPTITMTTTDPGEGSALAANNFIGVYGEDPIILDYSTSEINTGAKWIDGSSIYKKTINFGALPNATSKTVAHNISSLGRVIKFECLAYNPTSGTNTPIPLVSVVGNNSTMDISSTSIVMNTGVDRSSFTECYVTLYYTKSS